MGADIAPGMSWKYTTLSSTSLLFVLVTLFLGSTAIAVHSDDGAGLSGGHITRVRVALTMGWSFDETGNERGREMEGEVGLSIEGE